MKQAFVLLFCVALFAQSAFTAPLIFKTTKEIMSPDKHVEIAALDTSKYSRLRIHIVNAAPKFADQSFYVWLNAVEDLDEMYLLMDSGQFHYNTVIDTPPAKTRILIKGNGLFKVFIWGT